MLCRILGHKLAPVTPITSEDESALICVRCLQVVESRPRRVERPRLILVRNDAA